MATSELRRFWRCRRFNFANPALFPFRCSCFNATTWCLQWISNVFSDGIVLQNGREKSSLPNAVCRVSFLLSGNPILHTKQGGRTNLFLTSPHHDYNLFIWDEKHFLSSFSRRVFCFYHLVQHLMQATQTHCHFFPRFFLFSLHTQEYKWKDAGIEKAL